MKKLLICTQSIDPKDPIAGFFSAWVHEFAKHAGEVIVIALSGVGAETLPSNVRVISLQKEHKAGKMHQLFLYYRALIKERKNYDSIFVHNVGPKFIILGAPLWKLWHKRIALWYVHGQVEWKLRVAEKLADVIFSSAPETFRIPSKKINFLGHGIDTEALGALVLNPQPGCFTILQTSRIAPRKHCDVVIDALPIFATKYQLPYRMIFVGATVAKEDIEYLSAMKEKVAKLGLSDNVVFEGGVSPMKLREYYARANVTVNVSTTSGVDKVALESAASGVPVFTTFQAFRPIFGDLADEFVLPDLNEKTSEQLAIALYKLASEGISDEKRNALKASAHAYASLPVLIGRIINLIYGKTS